MRVDVKLTIIILSFVLLLTTLSVSANSLSNSPKADGGEGGDGPTTESIYIDHWFGRYHESYYENGWYKVPKDTNIPWYSSEYPYVYGDEYNKTHYAENIGESFDDSKGEIIILIWKTGKIYTSGTVTVEIKKKSDDSMVGKMVWYVTDPGDYRWSYWTWLGGYTWWGKGFDHTGCTQTNPCVYTHYYNEDFLDKHKKYFYEDEIDEPGNYYAVLKTSWGNYKTINFEVPQAQAGITINWIDELATIFGLSDTNTQEIQKVKWVCNGEEVDRIPFNTQCKAVLTINAEAGKTSKIEVKQDNALWFDKVLGSKTVNLNQGTNTIQIPFEIKGRTTTDTTVPPQDLQTTRGVFVRAENTYEVSTISTRLDTGTEIQPLNYYWVGPRVYLNGEQIDDDAYTDIRSRDTVTFTGKLYKDGDPVTEAEVTARSVCGSLGDIASDTTDANGEYDLSFSVPNWSECYMCGETSSQCLHLTTIDYLKQQVACKCVCNGETPTPTPTPHPSPTPTTPPPTPGYEVIFAITGLLATAYLLRRK